MITNQQLKKACQQLFTYSAQYQAPFYGRERSIAEMEKKTSELSSGEALMISQPLGTGKTFLVTHMISTGKLNIPRGASFLTVRGISESPDSMAQFPGDVLVVDEADIKTAYKKLTTGLEKMQEYLDKTQKKAIVIGDFSLRNQELNKYLKKKQMLQEYEPIDEAFLRGVLEQRFHAFLGVYLDNPFHLEDVITSDLIRAFTGEWILQVNNFRGIFSLLQSVVNDDRLVRYNSSPAKLELSMVMEHLASEEDDFETEEQEEYLRLLREYIQEVYPMGNGLTHGFTQEELYTLSDNGGIEVDAEDFAEEILYPLAQAGYLVSTGIPYYEGGEFVRRPLPFVPSLKLLLSSSQ